MPLLRSGVSGSDNMIIFGCSESDSAGASFASSLRNSAHAAGPIPPRTPNVFTGRLSIMNQNLLKKIFLANNLEWTKILLILLYFQKGEIFSCIRF